MSWRTPNAELVPYYNAYDCSRKIKAQMLWTEVIFPTKKWNALQKAPAYTILKCF
jgi:hypothetical protein